MNIDNKSNKIVLETNEEIHGLRLDQAIYQHYNTLHPGEFSRTQISDAIKSGNCWVNQKVVSKPSYKLLTNDNVEFLIVPNISSIIPDDSVEFSIIYEDEEILVISKPAGLVVHPAPSVKTSTLVHGLYSRLAGGDRSEFLEEPERLGIVHRLDRDTSGIMVVAKTMKAKRNLQAQLLPPRKMKRIYHAITYGQPKKKKGSVERYNKQNFLDEVDLSAPIGRDSRNRTKYKIDFKGASAKTRDSQTTFRLLKSNGDFNLFECRLETGRTHQLRVHLEYLESKILGDKVYGPNLKTSDRLDNPFIETLQGQLLHARTLSFIHPSTSEPLTFQADYYPDFQEALSNLGLEI